jgi:SAP domain-containing ribonucleoprotein
MDTKLKALKVVDLKDILSKASISVPAKANKNDLISKILASPAAVEQYHKIHSKPSSPNDDLVCAPLLISCRGLTSSRSSRPPKSMLSYRNASSQLIPFISVDWNADDPPASAEADSPSKPTSKASQLPSTAKSALNSVSGSCPSTLVMAVELYH